MGDIPITQKESLNNFLLDIFIWSLGRRNNLYEDSFVLDGDKKAGYSGRKG
jgi:hypothetical protein